MDMSPMAIDESHNHLANAIVLLLCLYPIIAWMLTRRFRLAGGELSRASVAFAVAPQFLGLATAWQQLAMVLEKRAFSGGGASSTAAGCAEALQPLPLAATVGAIVALCFLVQSRRGGWHRSAAWWFDGLMVALLVAWLVATVALARSVASPRFSIAIALTLAALALLGAIALFVVAMRRVRTDGERVEGRPAFAPPIGVLVFCVTVAIAVRHVIDELTRIAITGRVQ